MLNLSKFLIAAAIQWRSGGGSIIAMKQSVTNIWFYNINPRCTFGIFLVRIGKENEGWQSPKVLARLAYARVKEHTFLEICRARASAFCQFCITSCTRLEELASVRHSEDVSNPNLRCAISVVHFYAPRNRHQYSSFPL